MSSSLDNIAIAADPISSRLGISLQLQFLLALKCLPQAMNTMIQRLVFSIRLAPRIPSSARCTGNLFRSVNSIPRMCLVMYVVSSNDSSAFILPASDLILNCRCQSQMKSRTWSCTSAAHFPAFCNGSDSRWIMQGFFWDAKHSLFMKVGSDPVSTKHVVWGNFNTVHRDSVTHLIQ